MEASQFYSAVWQWPQFYSQGHREISSVTRGKRSPATDGLAATEAWSQNHGVSLGLHEKAEAAEASKSTKATSTRCGNLPNSSKMCEIGSVTEILTELIQFIQLSMNDWQFNSKLLQSTRWGVHGQDTNAKTHCKLKKPWLTGGTLYINGLWQ